ncbi:MAG: hypothetical protein HKM01_07875 [Gallionella sp.]|nr:hypothetical protein [Gallionella sp.]
MSAKLLQAGTKDAAGSGKVISERKLTLITHIDDDALERQVQCSACQKLTGSWVPRHIQDLPAGKIA